jgi:hypothetical protein
MTIPAPIRAANRVLALLGLGIVERRMGFWYVRPDGQPARRTSRYGWRLGSAREARDQGDDVTELNRLMDREKRK